MSTDGETKARVLIGRWVRTRMKALTNEVEIQMPVIADEAVAHFLEDQVFLRGPIADLIRFAAIEEARKYGERTRGLIPFGDALIQRDEAKARAKHSIFLGWLEHVGDRHIRFMEMTREDLLIAAGERRGRAQQDLDVASLEEALASKLEGGQKVRDRFTAEEIESMQATLERQRTIKAELQAERAS